MAIRYIMLLISTFLTMPNSLSAMEHKRLKMTQEAEEDVTVIVKAIIHNASTQEIIASHSEEYCIMPPPVGSPCTEWAAAGDEKSHFINNCTVCFFPVFNLPGQNTFQLTCTITPPSNHDEDTSSKKTKLIVKVPHNGNHEEPLDNLDKENATSPWKNLILTVENSIRSENK